MPASFSASAMVLEPMVVGMIAAAFAGPDALASGAAAPASGATTPAAQTALPTAANSARNSRRDAEFF